MIRQPTHPAVTAARRDRRRAIVQALAGLASVVTVSAVIVSIVFQFRFIEATRDIIRTQDYAIAELRRDLEIERGFLDVTRRELMALRLDFDDQAKAIGK